jgi:hypothetical protein
MRNRDEIAVDLEWRSDFDSALRRPLRSRLDYSFISTPQPIIDDEPYRTFDTIEDYRRWCRSALPRWLGYD